MRIDEFQHYDPKIRRTDSQTMRELRSGSGAVSPSGDQVALSNLSYALLEFGPQPARLARLHSEVRAGTYHVPSERISRRLVDEMIGN
jgi:anti-sigma28 factor (negative regulator of flagellin synthesis)